MAAYDTVAPVYSRVFGDISLRCFEWPWLKKLILDRNPHSFLDLGCGNGYLVKALKTMVPDLYAVEPSATMFRIAQEQIGESAVLYQASAENLPFANDFFDMVVSLLSFRYMNWETSLPEIQRVLKPEGTLILIDLFNARFNPFKLGKYVLTWAKVRLQYAGNKEYRRKLLELSHSEDWQKLTEEYPKRELKDAKRAVLERFFIKGGKLLCQSIRGKTVGLVCRKK